MEHIADIEEVMVRGSKKEKKEKEEEKGEKEKKEGEQKGEK